MAKFCLTKPQVEKFKKALKGGIIDPDSVSSMDSKQRQAFFSGIVGESNAQDVNALFESKLLLKNQKRGMVTWAKKVTGITPEVRRDLITRVQRMDEVLSQKDQKKFLRSLVEKKMGLGITQEEAQKISEMSKLVQKTKEDLENGEDGIPYGLAKYQLEEYVRDLKRDATKLELKEYANPITFVKETSGIAKSIVASLDNSFFGRQGIKVLFTNPRVWGKNFTKSFTDFWGTLKGKDMMAVVKSDIYSRENALNNNYKKMRLDIGEGEEAFPTSLPEKIPLFGRLFKASQDTYEAAGVRMRADVADIMLDQAEQNGVNLKEEDEIKSIGKLVNSLTGRGGLGKFEGVGKDLNVLFFSPKFMKSNWDTLTAHTFGLGLKSKFARKQAAINLLKISAGMGMILLLADTLWPDSVEWDPRSSQFGKIKIGSTTFDVTGGMSAFAVLGARIAKNSTKSITTDAITELGTGFGQSDGWDLALDFLGNKMAPTAQTVKNIVRRSDWEGNPTTIKGELANLTIPISIKTADELLKTPDAAPFLLAMTGELFGISTNTYSYNKNWNKNITKEMQQFKDKVGDKKFEEANEEFNIRANEELIMLRANPKYQALSDDDKNKQATKKKDEVKDEVFRKYGFRYKAEKTRSTNINL